MRPYDADSYCLAWSDHTHLYNVVSYLGFKRCVCGKEVALLTVGPTLEELPWEDPPSCDFTDLLPIGQSVPAELQEQERGQGRPEQALAESLSPSIEPES